MGYLVTRVEGIQKALSGLESGLSQEQNLFLSESFSSPSKKLQFLNQVRAVEGATLASWVIYFASFVRIDSLLVAIPEKNLVWNIGFGDILAHTKFEAFEVDLSEDLVEFPSGTGASSRTTHLLSPLRRKQRRSARSIFPLGTHLILWDGSSLYAWVVSPLSREKQI